MDFACTVATTFLKSYNFQRVTQYLWNSGLFS